MACVSVLPVLAACSPRESEVADPRSDTVLELPANPTALPVSLASSITLPWDSKTGVSVSSDGISGFETSFMGRNGLYVVDRVGVPATPRVRLFEAGKLRQTYIAPVGSYLFARYEDGFSYVIAKVEGRSSRAVIVDGRGKDAANYAIPLHLNSGGLRTIGDTLYTVAWSGGYDQRTLVTKGHDVLVPVAIRGAQASDQQASVGQIDALWVGPNGSKLQHISRLRYLKDPENYAVTPQRAVRIPNDATLLGMDDQRRTWVLLAPRTLSTRGAAGWPTRSDETALVVAFDQSGTVVGTMPIRVPTGVTMNGIPLSRRVSFDGRYLSFQDMGPRGLTIYVLEVKS
jgi:hypothetical protein